MGVRNSVELPKAPQAITFGSVTVNLLSLPGLGKINSNADCSIGGGTTGPFET